MDEGEKKKKVEFEKAKEKTKLAKQETERLDIDLEKLEVNEWKFKHPVSPAEDGTGRRTKVEHWFHTLPPNHPEENQTPDSWIEDYVAGRGKVSPQQPIKFRSADF